MPCIAPPPPVITASVTVVSGTSHPLRFRAVGASRNYIDRYGNMDFSCFQRPIVVVFNIRSRHVYFKGDGNDSLSFSDNAADKGEQMVLPRRHHQFPVGVQHIGRRIIWFVYRNDWDCGDTTGEPHCRRSAYGFYLVTGRDGAEHFDPIIQNGGSKY
jgi:hypothetical protein